MSSRIILLSLASLTMVTGCVPFSAEPVPGPDKQGAGMLSGAALGAGTGAVTGAQLSVGAGPAAVAGAGLGAVFGAISGAAQDALEEGQIARRAELAKTERTAWAQRVLADFYQRKLELHPSRDIFPADLFFDRDSTEVRCGSQALVEELARITKTRMPWSRIAIVAYVSSADAKSTYANFLTSTRSENLVTKFIQAGMEPRRLVAQSAVITEPVLLDPLDSPDRYRQAIEIIPLDR